jgi:hypothetical protein
VTGPICKISPKDISDDELSHSICNGRDAKYPSASGDEGVVMGLTKLIRVVPPGETSGVDLGSLGDSPELDSQMVLFHRGRFQNLKRAVRVFFRRSRRL